MRHESLITCLGRRKDRSTVFHGAILVKFVVEQEGETVQTSVGCPFNTGSHKHRCKASREDGVPCPYVVTLPDSIDRHFAHEENEVVFNPEFDLERQSM